MSARRNARTPQINLVWWVAPTVVLVLLLGAGGLVWLRNSVTTGSALEIDRLAAKIEQLEKQVQAQRQEIESLQSQKSISGENTGPSKPDLSSRIGELIIGFIGGLVVIGGVGWLWLFVTRRQWSRMAQSPPAVERQRVEPEAITIHYQQWELELPDYIRFIVDEHFQEIANSLQQQVTHRVDQLPDLVETQVKLFVKSIQKAGDQVTGSLKPIRRTGEISPLPPVSTSPEKYSVAEYLAQTPDTLGAVRYDQMEQRFIPNPDGEYLLIADKTSRPPRRWQAIPREPRLATRQDYTFCYQHVYDCDEPGAGLILIYQPAIVNERGQLLERGIMRIQGR